MIHPAVSRLPASVRFVPAFLALVAVAALLASGSSRPVQAAGWSTVGGNSQHNGLTGQPGPAAPNLRWQGTVNALFGGPNFIEDGRLATMRFQTIHVAPIIAYDLVTGATLWSVDFPGNNSRSVPRGFRDGKVYGTNFQETGRDTLIALDAATGHRVWVSEVLCERGITWGVTFAPDGDLFVPSVSNHIARVDQATGARVLDIPRVIPNTGAEGTCLFGNTLYGFEGSITTPKVVTAWDATTGQRKYSSSSLPGDGDQEIPLMVGPDGRIYALRDGGNLHALEDTGAAIVEAWDVPIDSTPVWGNLGVGIDGSLYVPDGTQLVRLDPVTGAELDRSVPLVGTSSFVPRVTVGLDGTVYVSNGAFDDGALAALTPDLQVLWKEAVPGIVYGGPALGGDGSLAVAGRSTILEVYWTEPAAAEEPVASAAPRMLRCSPNPFRDDLRVDLDLPRASPVKLVLFDVQGRAIDRWIEGSPLEAGAHAMLRRGPDAPGRSLPEGVYFLVLETPSAREVMKLERIR
jgi:outer membrane protein assembly factor BamB